MIDRDVFLSLLSLDAYNRGYGQNLMTVEGDNLAGENEIGRQIGSAVVSAHDISPDAQDAGFYAIAYQLGSETIISYRGTNFESTVPPGGTVFDSPLVTDALSGWTLGAGFQETLRKPITAHQTLPYSRRYAQSRESLFRIVDVLAEIWPANTAVHPRMYFIN